MYSAVLAYIADYFLHDAGRHGKAVAGIRTCLRSDGGVDADQFTACVDQRTARVTRVDGSIGLDERLNLHVGIEDVDVTCLGGHDTRGDSRCQVEGVADRQYPFAHAQSV